MNSADVLGPGGVIAQTQPGYQHRVPQLQFSALIDQAIAQGRHVISELGTGTGKSYSYLTSALVAGQRTIVTTTVKSLQEQLVNKDLPFLARVLSPALGRPVTFMYLKGKGNYTCARRVEKLQNLPTFEVPEAAKDWERFLAWYETTETYDLDEINPPLHFSLRGDVDGADCDHEGCPAKLAKERAKICDVVVANHALVVLDGLIDLKTDGHARVLPEATVLVLDEAHGLVDVASNVLGHEVSLSRLERLVARFVRLGGSKWSQEAAGAQILLGKWADDLRERMVQSRERQVVLGDERPFAEPLVQALKAYEAICRQDMPRLNEDDTDLWQKACGAVGDFAESVEAVAMAPVDADPDSTARYAEVVGGDARRQSSRVTLVARPVDVSEPLRRFIWERFPTVVATSATLATAGNGGAFAFFRQQTGVAPSASVLEMVAPSPFPYERNSLLYVPPAGAITAFKTSRNPVEVQRYHAQVAAEIERLVRASGGRAFCLFTSYVAMREAHARLVDRLPAHFRVFVQGEQSRTAIVEAFRDETLIDAEPAVLFATRSFFEGVDIPGRALELVILDALPFPSPSEPVYAAKCRRIGRQVGDLKWGHFFPLTIPMVTTVVKQAVGRLIRRDTDRGVVAILDRRIIEKGYGAGMRKALPPMPLTERFQDVHEVFNGGQ